MLDIRSMIGICDFLSKLLNKHYRLLCAPSICNGLISIERSVNQIRVRDRLAWDLYDLIGPISWPASRSPGSNISAENALLARFKRNLNCPGLNPLVTTEKREYPLSCIHTSYTYAYIYYI